MKRPAARARSPSAHFSTRRTRRTIPRPSGRIAAGGPAHLDVLTTMTLTRRTFVRTAAIAGIGGAYFGGAHLLLKDERWTPNRSFWVSRGREPAGAPLRGEREADLAIIGGGVTGLSSALHALLRSPGLRVVLLEAHYVGFGATGRSGGVLDNGTEMGTPSGTEDNVAHVIELVDRFGI